MSTAGLLAAYTVAVAVLARRVLADPTGRHAYPLLGVLGWLVACLSVLGSGIAAALLAAGWHLPGFADAVVNTCLTWAGQEPDHTHLAVPAVALPVLAAVVLRGAWTAGRGYAAELRLRRRHLEAVWLVGHADHYLGAVVVEAAQPVVYCLAGRRPTIVVSTRALRALTARQLAAALDHERCHLAERHHLLIRACHVLTRAFPFVPVFRQARGAVTALLEMRADDIAARRHGGSTVAAALAAVATTTTPPPALGLGGTAAGARAHRLLRPAQPGTHPWRLLATTALMTAGPFAGLLIPFCGG